MKPDSIAPREGEFNWKAADRLVELSELVRAIVVGHTLVWHQQTPQCFFKSNSDQQLDRETALKRLRSYTHTVVSRYKGRIKQWDVVNEAISDETNEFLRPTPWLTAIGEDYIAEAFRAAHEAILIYNYYNNDHGDKRDKTVRLLKSLIHQGVPIHTVGMQCHWQLAKASMAEAENSIQQYATLGLKVMFTEFDFSVLKFRDLDEEVIESEDNLYTAGLPTEIALQQAGLAKASANQDRTVSELLAPTF